MINWVVGGVILAITMVVVVRAIIRVKNGQSGCNCEGCDKVSNCSRVKK